ncbi:MAG: flagellar biosynthesis protein FlhG [Planctomycetota bacterium]|jgi:flagellar biosynthesis protein FlhG
MRSSALIEARAPKQSTKKTAPLVLFTGGKGGVGKSTLTADLGVHLAGQGKRVLLVDFDLGLANLDVLLRLTATNNMEDALAGRCAFEDCVVTGPCGVKVLPAGSGNIEMGLPDTQRREVLLAAVRELAADYDLVIGDSGAGIGHDALAFAAEADHVFVVTTPSPVALTDAYGFIKALDTWSCKMDMEVPTPELVINRVSGIEQAESTAKRLQKVCERFLCRRPRSAGWVPFSAETPVTRWAFNRSSLGGPKSLYHNCLCRLGVRVSRLLASTSQRLES